MYSDWGYKFTVTGTMTFEPERPLRPPYPALTLLRALKAMALEAAIKVLAGDVHEPLDQGTHVSASEGEAGDEPVDIEESAAISTSPYSSSIKTSFYQAVFPSLLKSLMLHSINSFTKLLSVRADGGKVEVDLSSIPTVSATYIARILQTYKTVSALPDPTAGASREEVGEEQASKPGVSSSDLVMGGVLRSLQSICPPAADPTSDLDASPRLNEDKVENFKEISPGLAAALSLSSAANTFTCPDQADLSDVLDMARAAASEAVKSGGRGFKATGGSSKQVDVNSPNNTSHSQAVSYRLKCLAGTTHCRIRSAPLLESSDVGILYVYDIIL